MVVKRDEPFTRSRECIIVPRQVLDGLLTALHIQLSHPSSHQLKMVTKRYLFALDMHKAIERVVRSCTSCAALSQTPQARIEQSSCEPPDAVGISFAADVLKRSRQLILVLRESVTSYTSTMVIEDERHHTLHDALVRLCIQLRPLDGPPAVIRTDPAPGFKSIVNDQLLQHHRIVLELGNPKNPNKNPVAERAVQELEIELLRQDPLGGAVSEVTLAVATANLNSRIRPRGLSSREMWSQRDQFSNRQLPMSDEDLITKQHDQRLINHPHSMKSKAPMALPRPTPGIEVGDLVYIHSDRNKSRARDRYLVIKKEGSSVPSCVAPAIASKSRSATMFLATYQQHTLLNVQTTPPGMKRTPLHNPLLLPHPRSHLQFLYRRISTSQSQKTLTFPWDQVLVSLWTTPQTTPQRGSFFPLRASTSRGVPRASVGAPHVTMIMLQTSESAWS